MKLTILLIAFYVAHQLDERGLSSLAIILAAVAVYEGLIYPWGKATWRMWRKNHTMIRQNFAAAGAIGKVGILLIIPIAAPLHALLDALETGPEDQTRSSR